jgi:hypothetical protein
VPRISFTVPFSSFARDLNLIVLAISITSSRDIDLLCLIFFSFFRSRGGSLRALITSEDADGTTDTAAWRFWIVSLTVTRSPFYNYRRVRTLRSEDRSWDWYSPSRLWLLRYLLQPFLGTGREDQS